MYANGLCVHNNMAGYCPNCERAAATSGRFLSAEGAQRTMKGMGFMSYARRMNMTSMNGAAATSGRFLSAEGAHRAMNGAMGAECPPGYYRLKVFGIDTGQCLPTGSTAASAAQSGVLSSAAQGVAQSPATQAAVTTAAGNTVGNYLVNLHKENPILLYGGIAVVTLLALAGTGLVRIPGLSK